MHRLSNWIFPFRDRTEPTEHGPFVAPVKLGRGYKLAPDAVVRTIRANRGKLPKEEIARRIGMTVAAVERLAHEHRIDLRCPPATESRESEPRGA